MTTIYLFVLSILRSMYLFVSICYQKDAKVNWECNVCFGNLSCYCYLHILTSSVRRYLVIRILPRIFYFTKYSRLYLCNDFFSSQLHILAIVAADNNEDDDNIWLKICWKNVVCLGWQLQFGFYSSSLLLAFIFYSTSYCRAA